MAVNAHVLNGCQQKVYSFKDFCKDRIDIFSYSKDHTDILGYSEDHIDIFGYSKGHIQSP